MEWTKAEITELVYTQLWDKHAAKLKKIQKQAQNEFRKSGSLLAGMENLARAMDELESIIRSEGLPFFADEDPSNRDAAENIREQNFYGQLDTERMASALLTPEYIPPRENTPTMDESIQEKSINPHFAALLQELNGIENGLPPEQEPEEEQAPSHDSTAG